MSKTELQQAMERLPLVDEESLAKRHAKLFHYTKLSNLRSIVSSGGLFATHYEYTNDQQEFEAAQLLIRRRIQEAAWESTKSRLTLSSYRRKFAEQHGGKKAFVEAEAATFVSTMRTALNRLSPPHITCFAAHTSPHEVEGGLLTMWRYYGGEVGVALKFDTQRLIAETVRLMEEQVYGVLFLDEVTYGVDHPAFLRRVAEMEGLISGPGTFMVETMKRRSFPDQFPSEFTADLLKFIVTSITNKHPAFVDEREVRLVASLSPEGREFGRAPIPVGATNRMLVQCIGAFEGLMVGPGRDQASSVEEARRILEGVDRSDVKISVSPIPYRVPP